MRRGRTVTGFVICTLIGIPLMGFLALETVPASGLYPLPPSCDKQIIPSKNDRLGYRARGGWCEGRCIRQLSSTSLLSLISFTSGAAGIDPAKSRELMVRWDPAPANQVALQVNAVGTRTCYRLDADLPMNSAGFRWSTEIMAAVGLDSSEIAVLGRAGHAGTSGADLFIPVQVSGANPVRSTMGSLRVGILPTRRYKEMYVTLTKEGEHHPIVDAQPLRRGYYPEHRPIIYELPSSVPRRTVLQLFVTGTYERGDHTMRSFLFIP